MISVGKLCFFFLPPTLRSTAQRRTEKKAKRPASDSASRHTSGEPWTSKDEGKRWRRIPLRACLLTSRVFGKDATRVGSGAWLIYSHRNKALHLHNSGLRDMMYNACCRRLTVTLKSVRSRTIVSTWEVDKYKFFFFLLLFGTFIELNSWLGLGKHSLGWNRSSHRVCKG